MCVSEWVVVWLQTEKNKKLDKNEAEDGTIRERERERERQRVQGKDKNKLLWEMDANWMSEREIKKDGESKMKIESWQECKSKKKKKKIYKNERRFKKCILFFASFSINHLWCVLLVTFPCHLQISSSVSIQARRKETRKRKKAKTDDAKKREMLKKNLFLFFV